MTDIFRPRILLCASLLLLLSLGSLFGEEIDNALSKLSPAQQEKLDREGQLFRFFFSPEDAESNLIPETPFSRDIQNRVAAIDPNLGVESLYLLPYPDGESYQDAVEKSAQILFQVSSMEGIEYYSASRERMRTLFTESRFVDNMENRRPLPDPSFEEIPVYRNFTILQTDLTFGTNIYNTDFYSDAGVLRFSMQNMTKMKYKFVTMVSPEALEIHLLVYPLPEGILFYGVCSVDSLSFFGLERKKKDSFYHRIEALKGWFCDQYGIEQ